MFRKYLPQSDGRVCHEEFNRPTEIESRATSSWEHGNPIHRGTQAIFKKYAISYDRNKTSQQISAADFADFDYVIGMDESNVRDLKQMAPEDFQYKIYQFEEESVPDPWYTGDFDQTYDLVLAGCKKWLERLDG